MYRRPGTGPDTPVAITVFNFSASRQNAYCDEDIDFFGAGAPERFDLVGDDGSVIKPDVTFKYEYNASLLGLVGRPVHSRRYRVRFEIGTMEPMSWTSFKMLPVSGTKTAKEKVGVAGRF